jgi:hypothetical protein
VLSIDAASHDDARFQVGRLAGASYRRQRVHSVQTGTRVVARARHAR